MVVIFPYLHRKINRRCFLIFLQIGYFYRHNREYTPP